VKVKELIRQLQELDPTGEIEVVGCAGDIDFVDCLKSYYDGHPGILIRDGCNILGIQIGLPNDEWKIVLREMNMEDVLLDNPDAQVIIDTGSPQSNARYQERADKIRAKSKAIWDKYNASN
jgi:hypothetical protein